MLAFLLSCKKTQENKQKRSSDTVASEVNTIHSLKTKKNNTDSQLRTVINNENYKEKLKKIKFEESEVPVNVEKYICNNEIPDYYLLLKDERLILVSEQVCGDFGGVSLTSIKGNKVLQILAVSGEHYEPDNEEEYKVVTSFTIDKNHNIVVTDITTEYGEITNKKVTTYTISPTGEFLKKE